MTDADDSETKYDRHVLRKVRHPRTGERLSWRRMANYYQASKRIWDLASALFGRN